MTAADVTREEVARAGGTRLETLLQDPTREVTAPVMAAGATKIVTGMIAEDRIHAVLGLGGLQGTAACTQVMRALPYGFPKIMVSTVASGDTSSFVGVKDITMMFSVSDILGLNPLTRQILANAAGAAHGMAQASQSLVSKTSDLPVIAMTNLGVLTDGAMIALAEFRRLLATRGALRRLSNPQLILSRWNLSIQSDPPLLASPRLERAFATGC